MIILKQGKTNTKYLLIVAILAVIVGGGIFARQFLITSGAKTPEELAGGKIADWQTYRNEEYKFEVKYPKNYFAKEPFPDAINFMENKYKDANYLFPFLRISFIKTDLTLEEYIDEHDINTSPFFSDRQLVKVNGIDIFRYHSNASGGEFDKAIIRGEDAIIEFANEINGSIYFPKYIFGQILSTFRFLE